MGSLGTSSKVSAPRLVL